MTLIFSIRGKIMGWLIVFLIQIACICFVLGYIPTAGALKLLLMFVIGFVLVWAFFKMWEDFDEK